MKLQLVTAIFAKELLILFFGKKLCPTFISKIEIRERFVHSQFAVFQDKNGDKVHL